MTWATGAPTFDSTNVKAQLCFREMEKTIIGRMKRIYIPEKKMDLLPWFEHSDAQKNSKPANHLIIGNTASGKTTFLNRILCQLHKGENWATGRKIIAFTMHPGDESLAGARKCLGSRRELNMARSAAAYITLFTGTSKTQAVHFLKSRLGYTKILDLLKKAGAG